MIGFDFWVERSTEGAQQWLKVDPSTTGFFDGVLGVSTYLEPMKTFVDTIREISKKENASFWKPAFDPSIEDGKIVFKAGKRPAVGHSVRWWREQLSELKPNFGYHWELGTDEEYYIWLVQLINQRVERTGENFSKAVQKVCLDSTKIGPRWTWIGSISSFIPELTGKHDLTNTFKILDTSDENSDMYCVAGGCNLGDGTIQPLAELYQCDDLESEYKYGVAWAILK